MQIFVEFSFLFVQWHDERNHYFVELNRLVLPFLDTLILAPINSYKYAYHPNLTDVCLWRVEVASKIMCICT